MNIFRLKLEEKQFIKNVQIIMIIVLNVLRLNVVHVKQIIIFSKMKMVINLVKM